MQGLNIQINKLSCRICFIPGRYDLNVHSFFLNDEKVTLKTALSEFSKLSMETDPSILPTMVCSKCLSELMRSYEFLYKVKKSDDILKHLIRSVNIYEEPRHDIVEEIQEKNDSTDDEVETRSKTNNNKVPNIIVTRSVSNILSKVRKTAAPSSNVHFKNLNHSTIKKTFVKRLGSFRKKSIVHEEKKSLPVLMESDSDENDCTIQPNNMEVSQEVIVVETTDKNMKESVEQEVQEIPETIPIDDEDKKNLGNCNFNNKTNKKIKAEPNSPNKMETDDTKQSAIEDDNIEERSKANDQSTPESFHKINLNRNGNMYKCKYCSCVFSTEDGLDQHIKTLHYCQICSTEFEKTESFLRHIRDKHRFVFRT